jgi:hypothetical protein
VNAAGERVRPIEYIADFEVTYADGRKIVYDVKGVETEAFRIKRKMFGYAHKDKTLLCVTYVKKRGGWLTTKDNEMMKKAERKQQRKKFTRRDAQCGNQ